MTPVNRPRMKTSIASLLTGLFRANRILPGRRDRSNSWKPWFLFLTVLTVAGIGLRSSPANAQTSANARLAQAVEMADLPAISTALQDGASPDAMLDHNAPAICLAARRGQAVIVRILLEHGAHVNGRTVIDHTTVLMFATYSGNLEMLRLLLDRKAKVNAQDVRGESALMMTGRASTLRMLLKPGANKELRNKEGQTALLLYANYGHDAAVQCLLDAGAKVNARDKAGNTALILAAGWEPGDTGLFDPESRISIVRYLLKHGADVRAKTHAGLTVLKAASEHKHPDIVELIQKYPFTKSR